jgi:protoheme IX farnesyltransferase
VARLSDYLALTKPRVVAMVLVTTAVGFHLGSPEAPLVLPLLYTLAGTALAAAGTLALNQYMERDLDARWSRTRHRPLPEGRVHPGEALVLGCASSSRASRCSPRRGALAAVVTAAIAITYLLVYTPLKRVSSLCSLVGAIPGALPPVAGWAAARGTLGPEPVDPLRDHVPLADPPHARDRSHVPRRLRARRDPRAAGGRPRRPDDRPPGGDNCLALLPVALLPTVVGLAGAAYSVIALVLGLAFLWSAVGLARGGSSADARRLLFASLVYLPVVLAAMALDKLAS